MQVVYVREGVAVWPAKTERIMGRLSLLNQHSVLFICWLPYSEGQLRKDGTFLSPAGESAPSAQSRGELWLITHMACHRHAQCTVLLVAVARTKQPAIA